MASMTVFAKISLLILLAGLFFLVSSSFALPDIDTRPGDNHWPFTQMNGTSFPDVSGTRNATVIGDQVSDDMGVLTLPGEGRVDLGEFVGDCVSSPNRCRNGLTISFWMKHRGFISYILGTNALFQDTLHAWLESEVPKNTRWVPCFRASTSQWSGAEFHAKCDGKGSTVTLVRVRDYVFGGFLKDSWPTISLGTSAFMFSLGNLDGRKPFKLPIISPASVAATSTSTSMPCFGRVDLVLSDVMANISSQSTSDPGYSYQLPKGITAGSSEARNLLAGSFSFNVDEVEVFYAEDLKLAKSWIISSGADTSSTGVAMHTQPGLEAVTHVIQVQTKTKKWLLSLDNIPTSWHHVTMTWDLTNGIKYFQDGTAIATSESSTILATPASDSATHLWIGSSSSAHNLQMYALTIWRAVISDQEINDFMNTAYSPMIDDESSDFTWSSNNQRLSTPSSNTGPPQWTPRMDRGVDDFYYNSSNGSPFSVSLGMSSITDFTICWWYNNYGSGYQVLAEVYGSPSNFISFGTDALNKYVKSELGSSKTDKVSADTSRGWRHICVTWNQEVQMYLDGRHLATLEHSGTLSGDIKLSVGATNSGSYKWIGLISALKMWDRVLDVPEMQSVEPRCSLVGGNLLRMRHLIGVTAPYLFRCSSDYMYIEASFPREIGNSACLMSSEFVPQHINCIEFYYALRGADMGRLNLFTQNHPGQRSLVWSAAGNHGDSEQWELVRLPLNVTLNTKLVFEGIVGNGYRGDAGISRVQLTAQTSCVNPDTKGLGRTEAISTHVISHVPAYRDRLLSWLREAGQHSLWQPCFSLSRDGWLPVERVYTKCADKGALLLIVRYRNHVFALGQCLNSTKLASDKAFLFSFKSLLSDAPIKIPVKPSERSDALGCRQTNPFPEFGRDLMVDHTSKVVTAEVGAVFDHVRKNFVDTKTFEPSDVEILVPSTVFSCPMPCPDEMLCNELLGVCECDLHSRSLDQCEQGISLNDFLLDVHALYPLDHPNDIKNTRAQVWGESAGDITETRGLRGRALSLASSASLVFPSHECLLDPTSCTTGISVLFWFKYSERRMSELAVFFCSGSCQEDDLGFKISHEPSKINELALQITQRAGRCTHRFACPLSIWSHVVVTWITGSSPVVYVNGAEASLNSTCEKDEYTDLSKDESTRLGVTTTADFDDYIQFLRVLNATEISNLYTYYRGRTSVRLDLQYLSGNISWDPDLQDKESKTYEREALAVTDETCKRNYTSQASREILALHQLLTLR
ncbi:uncharacterized protein LOC116619418 isoform X2 [Nematostella vectensis]|uniref:uncharacterized protein LOC116619418 isoform X2 n=1 Tax=Nematostella vectensis TaxID=45351 RepID=UPI00207737F0|nr:uncharacterized protein LOC116619418 isoform X2 [Nematostella vectensis]